MARKLTEEQINDAPHWSDVLRCNYWDNNGRCKTQFSRIKTYKYGAVEGPSGEVKQKLYSIGYCDEHDEAMEDVEPIKYETVRQYFERVYQLGLKNDPLVRAASSEEDKSLLLQALKRRVMQTLVHGSRARS